MNSISQQVDCREAGIQSKWQYCNWYKDDQKSKLDDNGIVTRDKAKLDARFQVDPKEFNLIAINKIIRYLKELPTLGVKHPKDIVLNMFGYIDIDYAGCKKDRRSISEAVNLSDRRSISGSCQLHGRRLISCYDEKQPQIQQLFGTLYDKAP
ncbi:hypothetical protein AgCh_017111 [Apium graveolens]